MIYSKEDLNKLFIKSVGNLEVVFAEDPEISKIIFEWDFNNPNRDAMEKIARQEGDAMEKIKKEYCYTDNTVYLAQSL